MRITLTLCVFLASTAASLPQEQQSVASGEDASARDLSATSSLRFSARPEAADCGDKIVEARAERGLPRLDRKPANADEPYLIAAVDKRIDGCSVMVMRDNLVDIRLLPQAGEAEKLPALQ